MKSFKLFGRLIGFSISKSWDGWVGGLLQCKRVLNPAVNGKAALRIVVWRLIVWIELK